MAVKKRQASSRQHFLEVFPQDQYTEAEVQRRPRLYIVLEAEFYNMSESPKWYWF